MKNVNDQSAQVLKDGSAGSAVSTGVITWISSMFELIGTNAAAIGAICSMISLVAYIYFQHQVNKKTKQSDKNTIEIERLKTALAKIDDRK